MNELATAAIKELEHQLSEMPQAEVPTREMMMGALYVREIIIPKGCAITSRVYKRAYVDVMISGDITITDTNGTYWLSGYNLLEGVAGRKRAGYAHEDTVWLGVFDSSDIKTDPAEDLSFETLEDYQQYANALKHEAAPTLTSERKFKTGDIIGPHELAQKIVSSKYPNAAPINGSLVALRAIDTGQEITKPYEV